MLNVTLFDVNKKLCEEWEKVFSLYKNVNIQNIELDKLDIHDILVTAGNSYGIMTGGIDYYVNKLCKFKAQSLVQQAIDNYWGKLPIGKFVSVDIEKITKGQFKVLVYAPTMETPQIVPAENVFKVFYPIIRTYRDTNLTLACPGLCSLTGGVSEKDVAEQMKKAYDKGMGKE